MTAFLRDIFGILKIESGGLRILKRGIIREFFKKKIFFPDQLPNNK